MNGLDLLALVLLLGAVVGGWRLGFVTRMVSWVGLLVGLMLATRVVPMVMGQVDVAGQLPAFLLTSLILVAGASLGQGLGFVVGSHFRSAIPKGPARSFDHLGGACAGAVGVLVILWLLVPAMADVPSWPSRQARNSTVAGWIHDHLPSPPAAFDVADLFGGDFPSVFDGLAPAPEVGPPPAEVPLSADVLESARASVVRTEGEACGGIQSASGFVVAPERVVTNAHAVAGVARPEVVRDDGERLAAQVIHFDPGVDLAILAVPGMDRDPLPVGEAGEGDVGAVLGFPGGGDFVATPYAIGREVVAQGTDIYDDEATSRRIFVLASDIVPGDSGSALLSPAGEVVGVAFAIAPDAPGTAYALRSEELLDALSAADPSPAGTGECLP